MTRYDEIRTERLLMRPWQDADREPFAVMNADPMVMRYFPALQERAMSEGHVDRIQQHFAEHGFGLWALEPLESRGFIGYTGLNPLPEGVPGAGGMEVGWRLMASAWGHGYATEAARAALDVAFGGLGFDEIWSMTAVLNTPSTRVMERLGMTPYTGFEHPRIPVGHPTRPHVMYRITRDAWSDAGAPS